MSKVVTAMGLMSGTSMDGIDAAIIRTDGVKIYGVCESLTRPYDNLFKDKIRKVIKGELNEKDLTKELTVLHAELVLDFIRETGRSIDLIGFHGHTIDHRPHIGITKQIGDGDMLANLTGINVVNDFRSADVAHGGQGAPLVPLYHAAITRNENYPVAIVNIGGVANITWLGGSEILAFDTGPGNAMIDDYVFLHLGKSYDSDGEIAAKGRVDYNLVNKWLDSEFFKKSPPKSLDRNAFILNEIDSMKFEDGVATLTAFTCESIAKAQDYFPHPVSKLYVTGGGRHNASIMRMLERKFLCPVVKIEDLGYDGDALEAQAFAFLSVRSIYNLPTSLPSTTGVSLPLVGGVFCLA